MCQLQESSIIEDKLEVIRLLMCTHFFLSDIRRKRARHGCRRAGTPAAEGVARFGEAVGGQVGGDVGAGLLLAEIGDARRVGQFVVWPQSSG